MWKMINSPVVVVILASLLLIGVLNLQKPRMAMELRAVSEELDKIIQEGGSDSEKAKAIRDFANSIASNLKDGFSSGFGSNTNDIKELDQKELAFIKVKELLTITDVKQVDSGWDSQEKHIFTIQNNSDKYITSLHVSMEYYKDDVVVDCEEKWLSNIKILTPGEKIVIDETRRLPKEEPATSKAKSNKLRVVPISFTIKNAPQ